MDAKSLRSKALLEFVQMMLSHSKAQDSAHDLDHIIRVWKIGMHIGEAEKADLEILEPALLLHDVVRPPSFLSEEPKSQNKGKIIFTKNNKNNHAANSAALSRKILPDFNYRPDEIERIAHAIESHEFLDNNKLPQTLEAKIVYDADGYDILGHSGCARCAIFCAKEKMTTSEMAEWYLLKIKSILKSAPFHTRTAINLANNRLTISLDFCKELLGKEKFENIMTG